MDKAIEELFRVFNHLARELQVYFLGGFIILLNVHVLDHFYYDSSLWSNVNQSSLLIPSIVILAYILGHISMGFFYALLELSKLDKKINRALGLDCIIDSDSYRRYSKRTEKHTYISLSDMHSCR